MGAKLRNVFLDGFRFCVWGRCRDHTESFFLQLTATPFKSSFLLFSVFFLRLAAAWKINDV